MNHLVAVKPVFDFAHGSDAFADRHLFLVAGVKVDETQKKDAAGTVGDLDNQLLARFERYFLMDDLALNLTRHADRRILNRHDVRLVLVTQRQVQHQIPCGMEVEFFELLSRDIGNFELFLGFGRHLKRQLIESLLYFIRKQKGRLNAMFQTAFKAEYLKRINI